MAKVYLLTDGCYSDFHVVGVFSTREAADEAMASYKSRTGYDAGNEDVQEYELDSLVGFRFGPVYAVEIATEGGEIREVDWLDRDEDLRHREAAVVNDPGGGRIVVKSPLSIEHATKVAIEKRQEWLRKRGMEPCG